MALTRAPIQPIAAPILLPNSSINTNLPLSVSTPAIVMTARADNRRRGFVLENSGSVPMVFALAATVTATVRTARLEPNDVYEDTSNWQGAVNALSIGAAGSVNVTELLIPA